MFIIASVYVAVVKKTTKFESSVQLFVKQLLKIQLVNHIVMAYFIPISFCHQFAIRSILFTVDYWTRIDVSYSSRTSKPNLFLIAKSDAVLCYCKFCVIKVISMTMKIDCSSTSCP